MKERDAIIWCDVSRSHCVFVLDLTIRMEVLWR